MTQVKPMKKVHVAVSLHGGGSCDGPLDEGLFSFIYGIGKDGLTPFESNLEGCSEGDSIQAEVDHHSMGVYFGSLFSSVRALLEGKIIPQNSVFRVQIQKVEDADNREVVAALANSAGGCSSGGSCGCGCS